MKVWDCTHLTAKGIETGGNHSTGLNCTHFFKSAHEGLVVRKMIFHSMVKTKDKDATRDLLWVISSGDDSTVRIWDLIQNECIAVLKDHMSVVTSLLIQEHYLITAGRDKVLNIWNLKELLVNSSSSVSLVGTIPTFEVMEGAALLHSTDIPDICLRIKSDSQRSNISRFLIATGGELGELRVFDPFQTPNLVYGENLSHTTDTAPAKVKTKSVRPQYLQIL